MQVKNTFTELIKNYSSIPDDQLEYYSELFAFLSTNTSIGNKLSSLLETKEQPDLSTVKDIVKKTIRENESYLSYLFIIKSVPLAVDILEIFTCVSISKIVTAVNEWNNQRADDLWSHIKHLRFACSTSAIRDIINTNPSLLLKETVISSFKECVDVHALKEDCREYKPITSHKWQPNIRYSLVSHINDETLQLSVNVDGSIHVVANQHRYQYVLLFVNSDNTYISHTINWFCRFDVNMLASSTCVRIYYTDIPSGGSNEE